MTPVIAQLLTILTIVALGALAAILVVTLLPPHLRTAVPVLLVGSAATATVAFGTELADTLPRRIVATHAASGLLAELNKQLPRLHELTEANPLVEHEILSAFHSAYLSAGGSAHDRAVRAGYSLGHAVQQAFVRGLPNLSDTSAQRLIGLEREELDVQSQSGSDACGTSNAPHGTHQDPQGAVRMTALRRAVLRAKIAALVEAEENLPLLNLRERAALETRLLAEAAALPTAGDGRCARLLAFYVVLQQQPAQIQGKWLRSRQMLPAGG